MQTCQRAPSQNFSGRILIFNLVPRTQFLPLLCLLLYRFHVVAGRAALWRSWGEWGSCSRLLPSSTACVVSVSYRSQATRLTITPLPEKPLFSDKRAYRDHNTYIRTTTDVHIGLLYTPNVARSCAKTPSPDCFGSRSSKERKKDGDLTTLQQFRLR